MTFSTSVSIPTYPFQIHHRHRIISIGSCFASHMVNYLRTGGFSVYENPLGIVYNPCSIRMAMDRLCSGEPFKKDDLFYHLEQWHSYFHHSDFSADNEDLCLDNINSYLAEGCEFLRQSNFLILTLGSALVYYHNKIRKIVNNCHKLPANHFTQRMLSVEEVRNELLKGIAHILKVNPKIKILITISPIRHGKNRFHENNLSKATLLLAAESIIAEHENVFYFPTYEIVMDELRDYRFYAEDMLHPSKTATNYVWEKFSQACFSEATLKIIEEENKLQSMKAHRVRNPNSEAYKQHLQKIADLEQHLRSKSYEKAE